ncbi:hypothetical protein B296_00039109 [Ensete ventricosum]|uniref:Uncharacterized protein n=1 Tax=Ensete ventricosum TaxID=4639 RepID=A0A426YKZ6_ENSVE|nr:hypothetical protein B296_00039109 [Ensete ventricosum]
MVALSRGMLKERVVATTTVGRGRALAMWQAATLVARAGSSGKGIVACGSREEQQVWPVIQLAEAKLGSGYLSTGQEDAEAGVTQEWVDEGEMSREQTKNRRWKRPYDVLAEATREEVIVRENRIDVSPIIRWRRPCMRVAVCLSIDQGELLGGHNGIEAGGRKGRGSDDESSGAQLPKSKASVRKEVDSEEYHNAAEADLLITKEGMQMQVNR